MAVSAPSELANVALHITLKLMQHTRSTSAARHTSFFQETREVMPEKSGCVGKATIQSTSIGLALDSKMVHWSDITNGMPFITFAQAKAERKQFG